MYLTKQKGYGRGSNYYELWAKHPKPEHGNGFTTWDGGSYIEGFCDTILERFTTVRLKAGTIRKVKSITFEFEDD